MNQHLLEREWIAPRLREFRSASSSLNIDANLIGYITELFGPFSLQIEDGTVGEFYYQDMPAQAQVWFAITDLYAQRFSSLFKWLEKQRKVEAPRMQLAYNALRARSDPRITSQESKFSQKNKKRASYRIVLSPEDNEWVGSTRIEDYFKRHRQLIEALVNDVEANVQRQKDVLESLVFQ